MLKKVVVILALLISLCGCSFKEYTTKSVEYVSILPSLNEEEEYQILAVTEDEIYVSLNQPRIQVFKEKLDGEDVLIDRVVETMCSERIYVIDNDTKEYRVLNHDFKEYSIVQFYVLDNDMYVYRVQRMDRETFTVYEDTYVDYLDMSNRVHGIEGQLFSVSLPTHMAVSEDGIYFAIYENPNTVLYTIKKDGTFNRDVIADYGYGGKMQNTLYVWLKYTLPTAEVYDIEKGKMEHITERGFTDIVSHLGSVWYFVNEDGLYTWNEDTHERKGINKKYVMYTDDYVVFEDEIWIAEDDAYRKVEFELSDGLEDAFVVNDRAFALVYEDRIDIIKMK
ncbi:MAG: hypothetical protein IJO78_05510 [Erysipelotrichaceae bacterium]|nr:hypothetical protein [Erysipelotrichaceae bacterium]